MDFVNEGIALGLDLIFLGWCVREYVVYKNYVKRLKSAPELSINEELTNLVANRTDRKVPYAVLRGTVTPIGVPIRSVLAPSVTGVLQVVRLNEHRVARGFAGLWTEQIKTIHVSSNEMPFTISNNGKGVEVINALSAKILDMDVVYDNYEPSSLSFFDHIFGFFSGVRQRGLQTTESFLRDGSFITAIGELEFDGKSLRLQPSKEGPLILTTATKPTIIKRLEQIKQYAGIKIFIGSAISIAIIGYILRRLYLKKKQERDERRIKKTIEKERRERRAQLRPSNLSQDQMCVVCAVNPKEIIILPCGHVCICEDCAEKIKVTCPVCRGKIESRAAAFIA